MFVLYIVILYLIGLVIPLFFLCEFVKTYLFHIMSWLFMLWFMVSMEKCLLYYIR